MYPTRGLCTKDKVCYVNEEWTSVPLRPSDCISTAKNKFQHEVTTQDLLVETLIREAQKEKMIAMNCMNYLKFLKIFLN